MIYLDSSALIKLVIEEPESAELERWLSDRAPTPMVSSELAKVEVIRAVRRLAPLAVPAARGMVAQLDQMPMSSDLMESAVDAGEAGLRSLDAIHLASAMSLAHGLSVVVAYDVRLIAAAREAGLSVAHPGAD